MPDAIGFLEALGRSPALPQVARGAWEALDGLPIGEGQRRALVRGDAAALAALLGGRAFMAMHILAPDGGEQPYKEGPDDDGGRLPGKEEQEEAEKPD